MVHCSKYVKAGLDENRLLRKRYLQRQKALMKYDKMTLRICIKNGRAYYYGKKKGKEVYPGASILSGDAGGAGEEHQSNGGLPRKVQFAIGRRGKSSSSQALSSDTSDGVRTASGEESHLAALPGDAGA